MLRLSIRLKRKKKRPPDGGRREDKHGRIETDQRRADIACKGRAGPGAEASERIADKPAGDRDMVSDRRRDWIMADVALVSGIRKALTYARQGVSAFKNNQVKYNKFWRD